MRRWLAALLVPALLLPGTGAVAQDIAPGTHWAQPWFTRLDVQFPGQGFHARWDFHRCDCGDAWIESEETLPEGVSRGEMLLVRGRVLLVRGFEGRGEDLRGMIDSPLLMLQLLFVLMQKTVPEGPGAVMEPRELALKEPMYPLELETGAAKGGFPAPWQVQGITRRAADGAHRFDLEFGFEIQVLGETTSRSEIHLSGMLDYQPREFPIDGDMALDGWEVISLRDDEADAYRGAGTLSDLRALIK